ncbi:uncharacterized protein LOC108671317 [Hyalella azteca]|uniref:Uncharacterized protein LOC108671317 n=1 Tax=Hyalella azteca TaxID=294128 RepID=A0A8B7NKZ8_HYAAZ|nr:uncharacterized protein LOC108671317 [Hyalella azteca]
MATSLRDALAVALNIEEKKACASVSAGQSSQNEVCLNQTLSNFPTPQIQQKKANSSEESTRNICSNQAPVVDTSSSSTTATVYAVVSQPSEMSSKTGESESASQSFSADSTSDVQASYAIACGEQISFIKSIDGFLIYVPTGAVVDAKSSDPLGIIQDGVTISLPENSNFPDYCINPKLGISCDGNETSEVIPKTEVASPETNLEASETLEDRLAKRNALLPPRQRRRIAPDPALTCVICTRVFRTTNAQRKHVAVCKRRLDNNLDQKALEDQSRHVCSVCRMVFPRVLLLQDHINFVHNKKRPLTCPQCPKKFYRPHDLKIHLNIHFGIKNYVCDTCGKQFHHISNLKRHQRTHSGVRPYACELCLKRFSQVVSLRMHMKRHINVSGATQSSLNTKKSRSFYCQFCGKTFNTKAERVTHEKETHENVRKACCSSCGRDFASTEALKSHICHKQAGKLSTRCSKKNKYFIAKSPMAVSTSNGVRNAILPEASGNDSSSPSTNVETSQMENSGLERSSISDLISAKSPHFINISLDSDNLMTTANVCTTATRNCSVDTVVMYLSANGGDHLSYVAKDASLLNSDGIKSATNVFEPNETIVIDMSENSLNESKSRDSVIDPNEFCLHPTEVTSQASSKKGEVEKFRDACITDRQTVRKDSLDVTTESIDGINFNEEVRVHTNLVESADIDDQNNDSSSIDGVVNRTSTASPTENISLIPSDIDVLRLGIDELLAEDKSNFKLYSASSRMFDDLGRVVLSVSSANLGTNDIENHTSGVSKPFLNYNSNSLKDVSNSTESRSVKCCKSDSSDVFAHVRPGRKILHSLRNVAANTASSKNIKNKNSLRSSNSVGKEAVSLTKTGKITRVHASSGRGIDKEKDGITHSTATTDITSVSSSDDKPSWELVTPSQGPFPCQVCSKVFNRKWNLEQHEGLHFPERQRYLCRLCQRSFAYRTTYLAHRRSHDHTTTTVACLHCGKEFKSRGAMMAHERRIHQRTKPHKCCSCDRSFHQRAELAYHLRLHRKEQPYVCFTCGRTFAHSSNLLRHERQHSGEKPHRCPYCLQGFIQAVGLKRHLKKHHSENHPLQRYPLKTSRQEGVQFSSNSLKTRTCKPEDLLHPLKSLPHAPPAEPPANKVSTSSQIYKDNLGCDSTLKLRVDGIESSQQASLSNIGNGRLQNNNQTDKPADFSSVQNKNDYVESFSGVTPDVACPDITDHAMANIGDVYGIIFMQ